jgi:hypothetical protein
VKVLGHCRYMLRHEKHTSHTRHTHTRHTHDTHIEREICTIRRGGVSCCVRMRNPAGERIHTSVTSGRNNEAMSKRLLFTARSYAVRPLCVTCTRQGRMSASSEVGWERLAVPNRSQKRPRQPPTASVCTRSSPVWRA